MSKALSHLVALLQLEQLEEGLFRGQSEDLGLRQVFGGQVIGQAMYAAAQTAPAERLVHSLHSYFLRPGDSKRPIIYEVETLRDGNSFSARRVSAIQHGKPIFYMTASFQAPEDGFEHQRAMPQAPVPETLDTESTIAASLGDALPAVLKNKLLSEKAIEFRPTVFRNPLHGVVDSPEHQVWMRANGKTPDDLAGNQQLLGYASDFHLLPVALQPHGVGFLEPGIQVATINHAIWFHRPFTLDDWLLYNIESTSASGGRGFVRGEFYTQEGALIATTAQEGVIRSHR